jgi:uncharacterized protein (TIGR02145 family)
MHNFLKLFCVLTALMWFQPVLQAQVIDVCVGDTISLSVSNYHYGTLQWQQSYDMEHWTDVPNAMDSILKVFPQNNTYYRAVAKFPDCPPSVSEVSFLQVPPKAFAGTDRIISGNQVNLFANSLPGATGQWTIVSGKDGSFSNLNDPTTLFFGTDTLYTLVWSITNACGTSTDTMQVRFRETVFNDNLAVIDTTDNMLSTSRQRAEGLYVIEFSDPVPAIKENTLLIGMLPGGNIRKVKSFTNDGNTYTIHTSPADLEDLIISGPFNPGDVLNMTVLTDSDKSWGNHQLLERMPTRGDLMNKATFDLSKIYIYPMGQSVDYLMPGTTLNPSADKTAEPLINIDMAYPELIDAGGVKVELSGNYKYSPNFVADLDYGVTGLRDAKVGSVNGIETKSMKIAMEVTSGVSLPKREFSFASITKYYLVIVGAVPILVDVNFKIEGEFEAFAGGKIEASYELIETNTTNAYIEYKDRQWNYTYNKSGTSSVKNSMDVTAVLEQKFSIGPVLSFKIYSVLGPYLEYKLEEELKLCVYTQGNWQGNLVLKSGFKLGAKAIILGKELVDFSRSWPRPLFNYTFPHNIEIWKGNNQTYIPGERLEIDPEVKVKSNTGVTHPFARVLFADKSGGEVRDSIVFAGTNGIARTRWIPGDTIKSILEVRVLDCNNNPVQNAPLQIIAYADTTDVCRNSALSASVLQTDTLFSPVAHLGVPPYQFSLDGSPFVTEPMEVTGVPGEILNFTVQDADECIATINYTVPDPCTASSLTLEIVLLGDTVMVHASGGLPPYIWSTDGENFTEVRPQLSHNPGNIYHFVVKDMFGCTASAWFAEPDVCDDYGLGFEWVITGNTLSIDPFGGFPSYTFELDGEELTEIPSVAITDNQAFTFAVIDQIGCKVVAEFDPCIEFELALEITRNESLISVKATGGVPPYTWSVDGENFSDNIPVVEPQLGITYQFFVMDQLGCVVETEYNLCHDSGLVVSVAIMDDEITVKVEGGLPPYLYAVNDTLRFSSSNSFKGLPTGMHTLYVKDANNCMGWAQVQKISCAEDGILIGEQCWMRSNLNVETAMSFCYDDDPANCAMYGRLYTWEAAMEACPPGWRLPSAQDFQSMEAYLKSAGYEEQWQGEFSNPYPNLLAKSLASKIPWQSSSLPHVPGNIPFNNNSSGFNGFPAGIGGWEVINNNPDNRMYTEMRRRALWWTTDKSTDVPWDGVHVYTIIYNEPFSYITSGAREGLLTSVRCIQK